MMLKSFRVMEVDEYKTLVTYMQYPSEQTVKVQKERRKDVVHSMQLENQAICRQR